MYLFQNLHLGKGASAERAPPATASCSAQPGDALWLENRHVKSLWKKMWADIWRGKVPQVLPTSFANWIWPAGLEAPSKKWSILTFGAAGNWRPQPPGFWISIPWYSAWLAFRAKKPWHILAKDTIQLKWWHLFKLNSGFLRKECFKNTASEHEIC